MPKQRLTKSIVDKLRPRENEFISWDESLPGFGVRVKLSGRKSYVVQYRDRVTGCSHRMTLGRHGPLMTFDQAKRRARVILADVLRGADPSSEKLARRAAPTVKDLCRDYIERHAIPNKRPRGVQDDRRMIEKEVLPALGQMKVASVARRDVETLHLQFRDKPYRGNRILALMSKMFNLSVSWAWRADNPVRGIPRFPEEKREHWLSVAELRRLWRILENHPNRRSADAVQLQILTGARLGEVLKARPSDFDLDRSVWTKPSAHTKQKRSQHLPLSEPARELVQRRIIDLGPEAAWLFPGNVPGKPLSEIKRFWRAVTEEAKLEGYRRHDNRHTYASHLVSDGLTLEIVGRLMGHVSPMTTKRYAHIADDPLRVASEKFVARLKS